MKYLLLLIVLSGTQAIANEKAQTPQTKTLGVLDGSYNGVGSLIPESEFLPKMSFTSQRNIHDGTIEAQSKAYLLGFNIVTVSAKLLLQPVPGAVNQFDILDLEQSNKKVGSASCDGKSCSFEAVVMDGAFTLKETWIPSERGFELVDGFQIFKGTPAHYMGSFERE